MHDPIVLPPAPLKVSPGIVFHQRDLNHVVPAASEPMEWRGDSVGPH